MRCTGTAEIRVLPGGSRATGTLVDLSVRGCCIEADCAIFARADDCIEVCFRVDGFALRLAGIVRHVKGEERVGIEFTHVCRRKEAQIRELVHELFDKKKAMGVCITPEKEPGWLKRSAM
jgi:hypothetical protein